MAHSSGLDVAEAESVAALVFFASRLQPSDLELDYPVVIAASTAGHQASMVAAKRCAPGELDDAAWV